MKEKIKNIIIVMLVAGFTSITVSAATLINSREVLYDNAKSGIESTTVQGAVDELYTAATDYSDHERRISNIENNTIKDVIDKIYPVGSIYMSTTEDTVEKVQTRFGGTWQRYSEGRTLIGVGTGTDSNGTVKVFNKNESSGTYNHRHKSPLSWVNHEGHGHFGVTNAYEGYIDPNIDFYGTMVQYLFFSGEGENNSNLGGYYTSFENAMMPYTTVYMYKRVS